MRLLFSIGSYKLIVKFYQNLLLYLIVFPAKRRGLLCVFLMKEHTYMSKSLNGKKKGEMPGNFLKLSFIKKVNMIIF